MRLFKALLSEIILLWLFLTKEKVDGGRILLIAPGPWYSHQVVSLALGLALNKRGHEVVIVTANPVKDHTLANYTEIDISSVYEVMEGHTLASKYAEVGKNEGLRLLRRYINNINRHVFRNSDVRKLYAKDSNEKFDAVIVEAVIGFGSYAFAHRFQAPLIGLATLDLNMYHHFSFCHPLLTSHPSNWEYYGTMGVDLPFWRRLYNFLLYWHNLYEWQAQFLPLQDRIVKNFLGNDVPHITEIGHNMSLVLVNHNIELSYSRPVQPNVIYFSGLHVAKTLPTLPKDMKEFLDNATEGFIYMSLGSNTKSADLPPDKVESIVEAFSKLPCKVLWKYEEDNLRRKLNNVFTAKWIPQQGVLAHPNIRLFIYQGGVQSTDEAIHYAVPVLGIPVMFDQGYRIIKLNSLGVGKHIELSDITQTTFYDAVYDVLYNSSYKTKMVELSALIKDKPIETTENVLWWIEHVMRHKGTAHLQFTGLAEPWYQKYDMDIIAFLTVILLTATLLLALALVQGFLQILKYLRKLNLYKTKCISVSGNSHKKYE